MSTSTAPGWDLKATPFPQAKRSDHVDTYESASRGKVEIADPYQWLEQPPSKSDETKQWVHAQADFAKAYINGYKDREEIKKRLEQSFSYPRFSCPSLKYDGNFYYSYNSGLDPQSTTFRATKADIDGVEDASRSPEDLKKPVGKVFFDSNGLSKDGSVALSMLAFSHTGKYLCYGISKAGSDWNTFYFRSTDQPFNPAKDQLVEDADKGGVDRLKGDDLDHIKFSNAVWTHDDKGIIYQRYPTPEENIKKGTETDANMDAELYYHTIGTKQADDVLIVGVDPSIRNSMWGAEVTDDGKYLIISNSKDTSPMNRYYIAALDPKTKGLPSQPKWLCLSDKFADSLDYLASQETSQGTVFYFMTNRDAPRSKILKATIDLTKANGGSDLWNIKFDSAAVKFEELIPEDADGARLSSATVIDYDKLLLVYNRNVMDELWQYDLTSGKQIKRLLPDLVGSIEQISGKFEDNTAFVQTSSFVSPGTITRLQWSGGKAEELPKVKTHRETQVNGLDPDDFVSEQRWFESIDGTKIPMFLTYHKDTKFDGTAPCWQYQYAGFNISITPTFSPSWMTFCKTYGAVIAVVSARGGGELGEDWHKAGIKFNKHHTFEDVISASKYLHENKIVAKDKIILNGGSNGGLTVMGAAQMATAEHGIGAIVAEVGVLDLLKYHTWTIGRAWVADFGCSEDPKDFDNLIKISPLHNVDEKKVYPTVALLTADHDDRVVPAHSFKMTAELQHKLSNNPNPILLRVDIDAGHGAGKSIARKIEEVTDKYSLVARALDLKIKH